MSFWMSFNKNLTSGFLELLKLKKIVAVTGELCAPVIFTADRLFEK